MIPDNHVIENADKTSYTVQELTRYLDLGDIIVGDSRRKISNIADAKNINEESLDWVHRNNGDPWTYLQKSKAQVLIVPKDLIDKADEISQSKTVIFSNNPMLLFSRIARELFVVHPIPGIHPSVIIHPNAVIAKDVYIGPLCSIGDCQIGAGSIIQSHVSIGDCVSIGKKVLIKNGARIGQSGFGFVKNENGELEKFPQIGRVIIEDNVEIGANTCVDRGALSITRIGAGTKIDNLVEIAHNVQIGKNCMITGNVSIGGSCKIGDEVWIGPTASLRDGIVVGSGALINMGSVVIKDVKAAADVIGYPAESKEIFVAKKNELYKLYKERREQ